MINKFKVKNFKGFKNTITLDLSKPRDYGFNKDLVKNGIVNKAIIYGKNGSGKSNIGFALYDLTTHLTDKQNPSEIFIQNYTNLNNSRKIADFTYEFVFNGTKVEYTYGKRNIDELVYEKVVVDGEVIINYDYFKKENNIVNVVGSENLRTELPDNKLSILKYIYKNTPIDKNSPITKIVEFAEGMLWFRCLDKGNNFISFKAGSENMDAIIIENGKLKDFEEFLSKNGLEYRLVRKDIGDKKLIFAEFEKRAAPFGSIISSGTRSLWLYYCWSIFFANVSFLFLDEFDAYYHYETAELVVKAINSNKNMQAIVTSHNTYLMKNSITRPDCCYILADGKINCLADCTEKEIRQVHNLEKMYRNGVFTE